MNVRWPDAQHVITALRQALREQIKDAKQLELFGAVCELFFPNKLHEDLDAHDEQAMTLPAEAHAG